MIVKVGNDHALEAVRDDNGRLVRVPVKGHRVTVIDIPDDTADLVDARNIIINLLPHHIQPGHGPAWIESSSTALRTLLIDYYFPIRNVAAEVKETNEARRAIKREPGDWQEEG